MNPAAGAGAETSATAQLRARLVARIGRRYQTTTQRVKLGRLELEFTRIANPDRVLDEVADEVDRQEKLTGRREGGDDLHLPYWAELWDSAYGIAQYLARQPPPDASHSVLDLGCGMGLAGTAAAALGASVMFADLEAPALMFATLNSLPWRDRVRTRRLNWRNDDLGERFDLIIGADIIYEKAQWQQLVPFWRKHLAAGGVVLLGEPGRQSGELFIEWIANQRWRVRQFEEKVETRQRPIRLIELRVQA